MGRVQTPGGGHETRVKYPTHRCCGPCSCILNTFLPTAWSHKRRCYMTGTIKIRRDVMQTFDQASRNSLQKFESVQNPTELLNPLGGRGTKIGALTRMHAAGDRQPTSPVSWIEKKNTSPEGPGLFCGDNLQRTRSICFLLPRNTYPRNVRSGCCRVTRRLLLPLPSAGILLAPPT